jgi:hypothetical protein
MRLPIKQTIFALFAVFSPKKQKHNTKKHIFAETHEYKVKLEASTLTILLFLGIQKTLRLIAL